MATNLEREMMEKVNSLAYDTKENIATVPQREIEERLGVIYYEIIPTMVNIREQVFDLTERVKGTRPQAGIQESKEDYSGDSYMEKLNICIGALRQLTEETLSMLTELGHTL